MHKYFNAVMHSSKVLQFKPKSDTVKGKGGKGKGGGKGNATNRHRNAPLSSYTAAEAESDSEDSAIVHSSRNSFTKERNKARGDGGGQ